MKRSIKILLTVFSTAALFSIANAQIKVENRKSHSFNRWVSRLIFTAILVACSQAQSEDLVKAGATLGIPYDLTINQDKSKISIDENTISIVAKKGTDLYTSANGEDANDNAPRVLFSPTSDFSFSAKVTANFNSAYDGGAIIVYYDTENWAKLLFEQFKSGDLGIASTVVKTTGDDAYHNLLAENEVYLKVVKNGASFRFYYSQDGEEWLYKRSFNFSSPSPVMVGLLAQSPISDTHKVVYSEIKFDE